MIHREENEMDFKHPLSPTPSSRRGSAHSTALPQYPLSVVSTSSPFKPSYGLMGVVGIGVTITIFLLDIVTDAILSYALWKQADMEENYYIQNEEMTWFLTTLLIFLVPMIVINILSFIWYSQNKEVLGGTNIFSQKSKSGKVTCVLLHVFLLGPLIRYVDILQHGTQIKRHRKRVSLSLGSRGSIHRMPIKVEINPTLQLHVMARDTAILDLLHSFFQDAPQLVYQIYLLYRSSQILATKFDPWDITLTTQLLKITFNLLAISWSLVSYQEDLRMRTIGNRKLSCGATLICLFWRVCMVGSRVVAIGSFASLQVNGEGGLVKVYSDNVPRGLVLSFSTITALVLGAHWILMIIWIHAQKVSFCSKEDGSPRTLLEFVYSVAMGWVHIFCYLNMKNSPSRRRIVFFYTLIFLENTGFILVWYLQLISKELWLRVVVVLGVEASFIIGLCCVIGYYAFLHPEGQSRFDEARKLEITNGL